VANGITWSDDTELTIDPDPENPDWDMNPSIGQTSDGSIWVVWVSDKHVVQDELYYKTSSDYGSTWSGDTQLTTNPGFDVSPSIIQALEGYIWVVWASDRFGNYDIFYKTSSDYGSTWSPDTRITTNSSSDQSPSVTQDPEGRMWVVWCRTVGGNSDIFYKTSFDYGLNWSSETQLTTDPGWDLTPSITQAVDGSIWVAWTSHRTGNYDVWYKTSSDYGSTWSDDTQFTTNLYSDDSPSIIQACDGSIWVVWASDRSGGQYDIYYANSSDCGLTWSEERLTTAGGDDITPSITNTDERTMWVAWQSERTGDFDIFYKTSDTIPVHDVAITDVMLDTTTVYRGDEVSIDVIAENQGTETETFEVDCYANTTWIGSQATTLAPETSTTLVFLWGTSVPYGGHYTISANTSVSGETLPNIADNTFTDGTVLVKILGDINGDGHVGLIDAVRLSVAYGQIPNPDPDADINGDGVVGLKDAVILSLNWTG